MRTHLLCSLLLIVCGFVMSPRVEAASGLSLATYSESSGLVNGYSETLLTYDEAYYYDAMVDAYLFDQAGILRDSSFSLGYGLAIASTWTPGTPRVRYDLLSDHYGGAFYTYCTTTTVTIYDCEGPLDYYDPFGFSNYPSPAFYGSFYNFYAMPVCYVQYYSIYLGMTGHSVTVPTDQNKPTPDQFRLIITPESIRPAQTSGNNRATVRVETIPASAGRNVTLQLAAGEDSGGHIDFHHIGRLAARPKGRLARSVGTTDSNGVFETTYSADIFSGRIFITATVEGGSATASLFVEVQGFEELRAGTNYRLIGFENNSAHPERTNHWGTPAANNGLVQIANDYKNQFYGSGAIPENMKLAYNDQSLYWGGKFDLDRAWSRANTQHAEHRLGINCDVRSNNVPRERWNTLNDIFIARGSTDTNDETRTSAPHWHLRFEFGQNLPNGYARTMSDYVPEVWSSVLDRNPTDGEWQYWDDTLTTARAQGQAQLLAETKRYLRALFESAEYANRNRSDEDFVTDLYLGYLQREPDEDGYNFWLNVLQNDNAQGLNGRERLLQGFENSSEFADKVYAVE